MRFRLDGIFLINNSLNSIINNRTGIVFYCSEVNKLVFRLLEDDDLENIGDYYVNPKNISRLEPHEVELMEHTKIYIDRPEGI